MSESGQEKTIDPIKEAKKKRVRQYTAALSSEDTEDTELKKRQEQILMELPDTTNLAKTLIERLTKSRIEHNRESSIDLTEYDKGFIQGELFEILVNIENRIFNLTGVNNPQNQELAEKNDLLPVSAFGLHTGFHFRHANMAVTSSPKSFCPCLAI